MEERLRRRTGVQLVDLTIALAAIVISCASLIVTLSEGRTQEKLLQASTWPLLNVESSNNIDGRPIVQLALRNSGVGPAHVMWLTIDYGGKRAAKAIDFLRLCCDAELPKRGFVDITSAPVAGFAIGRDQELTFFSLPRVPSRAALFDAVDRARFRATIRVCYCSVLDDCWLLESRQTLATRVATCGDQPRNAYRSGV